MSKNLRTVLRRETQADHATVDRLVQTLDLSALTGYTDFLRLHAAVLLPLERWLEHDGVAVELRDWPQRARSRALLNDLAHHGVRSVPQIDIALDRGFAARAGALYVIEGARLGSRVLANASEGCPSPLSRQFLLHGRGRGYWPSFVKWLNGLELSREDVGVATAAARGVFRQYEKAFAHAA